MSGPDPVSSLVIERGWKVSAADGEQIGTVADVVGDTVDDMFFEPGERPQAKR